jgi:plasmid rolling circle replication initiator protein Rep
MKHSIQSQKVIAEVMKRKPKCRWLFLTLSVKNVYDGEELDESLKAMS